jgi:uncharacterized protein YkwD
MPIYSNRFNILNVLLLLTSSVAYSQTDFYGYSTSDFRNSQYFQDTINPESPDAPRLNAVIFYMTNETRLNEGLSELRYNNKLEECAQLHSKCMVEDDFFNHINPYSKKLRKPNDRAHFVGIANPFLAENIIEGFLLQYTPGESVYPGGAGIFRYHPGDKPIKPHTYLSLGELLLKMWMNSPDHKANILSTHAIQLGCGSAFYFRKDFYEMPTVVATQNFQFYEAIQTKE